MRHAGHVIGDSRQPLFDAARYLLRSGIAKASDRIATFRGSTMCLRATVGAAAKLSVSESDRGLEFVEYRELDKSPERKAAA